MPDCATDVAAGRAPLLILSGSRLSRVDRLPHIFGRCWHLHMLHAKRRERVDDCIHHRLGAGNRACLTCAFHPHRVDRTGRDGARRLVGRQHMRRRNGVVHQRTSDQLPVLVVHCPLVKRLSDALRDAAVDLTIDDQRVDDIATVIDSHVTFQIDDAGIRVNLDNCDVRAEGEGAVRRIVVARFVEEWLHASGRSYATDAWSAISPSVFARSGDPLT
jgi:hypothetical protein